MPTARPRVIAVPLNVKPWRQQLISGPFLKQFRRMLPSISETEQVALDAGTVGWEGELFAGDGRVDVEGNRVAGGVVLFEFDRAAVADCLND